MIKGPKAILSSAIANALSEYFVLNPSTNIESNLLRDAKIVLKNVQLKPQHSIIPLGNGTATTNTDNDGATATAATIANITGSVDKVIFSWTWSVGGTGETGEWIRDALLVIEGASFQCCLEHQQQQPLDDDDCIDRLQEQSSVTNDTSTDGRSSTASLKSSFVNLSTIDAASAKTIKSTPGGIAGFVSRQIEMVIDNLTLRMVDFELKIVIVAPPPLKSGNDGQAETAEAAAAATATATAATRSFLIGVDQVELLSFGRKTTPKSSGGEVNTKTTATLLKQRINLRSFRSSVLIGSSKEEEGGSKLMKSGVENDGDDDVKNMINELAFLSINVSSVGGEESKSDDNDNDNDNNEEDMYHLIEPFSYSADVTRLGSKRFSGLMTGVEVIGIVPSSNDDDDHDKGAGGIVVHMGKTQVESLELLGTMILAPSTPNSGTSSNSEESTEVTTTTSSSSVVVSTEENEAKPNVAASENDPSSFILPLSFATLVADDTKFSISDISMKYKADGTICQFDAKKVSYECTDGGQADASNVYASMRPSVKMIIDRIDTLHIPDVVLLEKPVEFTELTYEGNALTARFHEIEMITFEKGQDSAPEASLAKLTTTKQSAKVSSVSKGRPRPEPASAITAPKLPFSLDVSVKGCHIKKSADGSSMEMGNFQLFCNENKVGNSSDVALNIGHFKNHLASVSDIYLCASIPFDAVNCINALNLSVRDAAIVSGKSVEDWQESFQPKYKTKSTKSSSAAPSPVIKLPNAAIADMKLVIVVKTKVGVKVKQTPLTIKAFNGGEATTSRDIINYYTIACLSRVPEFISNAEVLGLNVIDNTAATWGNFAGLATPFGGFAGLAAVVGVDAVKNTVSAGKRGRGKNDGDSYEASDVARGLFQAAKEATHRGATMRGKHDDQGNVIDWAVGATTTTTEYVGENKTRLGGAAAGGGGFLVGMALGGPVGAVIGGLVATAATGKTLETIDGHHQRKKIEQPKLANDNE